MHRHCREPRLGIDIGRVIINGPAHPAGGDTAFFNGDEATLRWLTAHDFYRRTGIPDGHVRFCRTRQGKRVHCEELSLTHFVDDHPEVHAAIRGTVDYQYFFGPQHQPVPGYGIHAPTWAHAEELITASLTAWERACR